MGFGGQVVSWTTQDSKAPRISLQCRRFPPIRPKPGQKRHIGESAPWKCPDLVGWQLAPAFRRCVWLSGLRPWLPGNLHIPDSARACPMPQPCIDRRQTWPAWELPCPWERLSRPSPAPELVQVPQGNVQTGLGIGLTSPAPAGRQQLRRTIHPRLCNGSFAGPSCRRQVVRGS